MEVGEKTCVTGLEEGDYLGIVSQAVGRGAHAR